MGQGTGAQGAGIKLSQARLQALWAQCADLLEQPLPDQEAEGEDPSPEEQAALQRKLAALNGFGRIALQQVRSSAHRRLQQGSPCRPG